VTRRYVSRKRQARWGVPRWVLQSLAPWSVAACLLVSFTASAGPHEDRSEAVFVRARKLVDLSLAPAAPSEAVRRVASLLFVDDAERLPPSPLRNFQEFDADALAALGRFVNDHSDDATTAAAEAAMTPGATQGHMNPAPPSQAADFALDGSTPAVARAVSLGSTTPAPSEPETLVVAPKAGAPVLATAPVPLPPVRPVHTGYSDLIDPEDMDREQRCLAEAVYFEARSEPPAGQAAVAQVVLNRVKSGLYPDSVCGVVYQNRHRYLGCQFTFACEGKSLRVTEPGPWKLAKKVARDVTFGQTYLPDVGSATHYHANYVRPSWSRIFKKTDKIGKHIFYKMRHNQT